MKLPTSAIDRVACAVCGRSVDALDWELVGERYEKVAITVVCHGTLDVAILTREDFDVWCPSTPDTEMTVGVPPIMMFLRQAVAPEKPVAVHAREAIQRYMQERSMTPDYPSGQRSVLPSIWDDVINNALKPSAPGAKQDAVTMRKRKLDMGKTQINFTKPGVPVYSPPARPKRRMDV